MKKIDKQDTTKVLGGATIDATTLMAGGEEDMPQATSAMVGEEEPTTLAAGGEEDSGTPPNKKETKGPTGKF